MRAVFFWEAAGLSLDQANPYAGLLARALVDVGVEMVAGYDEQLNEQWLRENRAMVDVLHLNWPHYMYFAQDLAGRVTRCAEFVNNLTLARALGYKVVWTVHNLYPHESAYFALDRLARLALTHLSTAVITHCEYAHGLVQQHFQRAENVFVIPHGHFIDAYPNTITRTDARRQLGIPAGQFVYLFFGNVRAYKGLENLLETFGGLPGEHITLLRAAKVYNDYGDQFVERARQTDPRIIVCPSRFFANAEFQLFFNAADVGIFPFLDVLTSGSTITALSFGLPVIVPAVGCLPELVDAQVGILYDQKQPEALKTAMLAIQQQDLKATSQAAYQRAQSLDWHAIARLTREAYRC
jgi:beta-1,4-mannosyltransferase